MTNPYAAPNDPRITGHRESVRFMCPECGGTGRNRWREAGLCKTCDGAGTIASYVELSR